MKNDIISISSSKEYSYHIDKLLERSKREILEWFQIPSLDFKITTFIYKDLPSLIEGLKKRGFGPYPDYMRACMIDEDLKRQIKRSINIYEVSDDLENKQSYTKKEYDKIVFHELIHYITDYLFGKLPEWVTEGIAKYLDGTYKKGIPYLMEHYIRTYEIPNINDMTGNQFVVTKKEIIESESGLKEIDRVVYDGYDYSYLIINYIIEVYGKDYLFTIMKQKDFLNSIAERLQKEALEYFNYEYNEEKNYKKS